MGELTELPVEDLLTEQIDRAQALTLEAADIIVIHMRPGVRPGEATLGGLSDWRRKYGITNPIVVLADGAELEAIHIEEAVRRAWRPDIFNQGAPA